MSYRTDIKEAPQSDIHVMYARWRKNLKRFDPKYSMLAFSDADAVETSEGPVMRPFLEMELVKGIIVAWFELKYWPSDCECSKAEKIIYDAQTDLGFKVYVVWVPKEFGFNDDSMFFAAEYKKMNEVYPILGGKNYAEWLYQMRFENKPLSDLFTPITFGGIQDYITKNEVVLIEEKTAMEKARWMVGQEEINRIKRSKNNGQETITE